MTLNKPSEYSVPLTLQGTVSITVMTVLSNVCKMVMVFQKDQAPLEQITLNIEELKGYIEEKTVL